MRRTYAVRRLDDIPVVPEPGAGEPDWKPLRHFFGIESFGVNVFVARSDGDRLVVDHAESEDGEGHEELYMVLVGEASFELDGERVDAVAGTFVAVAPEVRRTAVAASAGTTVMVVAGKPGEAYAVSAWDRRWTGDVPTAD